MKGHNIINCDNVFSNQSAINDIEVEPGNIIQENKKKKDWRNPEDLLTG